MKELAKKTCYKAEYNDDDNDDDCETLDWLQQQLSRYELIA